MYQILEELNKTSGITGSMLVGSDGIVIAADLETQLEDEAVGALAASVMSVVEKSMHKLKKKPLRQITIEAEKGMMFLTDCGKGILAVTTEPDVNIGLVRLEIRNAMSQIKEKKA